jgi:hypothetical protein
VQIKRDEPRRFRQFALGGEGQKTVDDLYQVKVRNLQAFRDTAVGKFQSMIEKIEILARTVGKVRLHDDESSARTQHPMHFGETVQHIFTCPEMFIDVAGKHGIQRAIGERSEIVARLGNDLDVRRRVLFEVLFVDIQRVFHCSMNRINEVAITRSEIQHGSFCREKRFQISADRYPIGALLSKFLIRKTIAVKLFFHRTEGQV